MGKYNVNLVSNCDNNNYLHLQKCFMINKKKIPHVTRHLQLVLDPAFKYILLIVASN